MASPSFPPDCEVCPFCRINGTHLDDDLLEWRCFYSSMDGQDFCTEYAQCKLCGETITTGLLDESSILKDSLACSWNGKDNEELYESSINCPPDDPVSFKNYLQSIHTADETEIDQLDPTDNMKIFELPCIECGTKDDKDFEYICDKTDKNNILCRRCSKCDHHLGVDDGMCMKELQLLIKTGKLRAESCVCGNNDPNKMIFESKNDDIVLVCVECRMETSVPRVMDKQTESPIHNDMPEDFNFCCKRCNNKSQELFSVAYDDTKNTVMNINCLQCQETLFIHDSLIPKCPTCDNSDRNTMSASHDQYGCCDKVKCDNCKHSFPYGNCKTNDQNGDRRPGRFRIRSVEYLSCGDHIAWHQTWGYWHHGIVVDVSNISEHLVKIIQYTGPLSTGPPKFIGGEIREAWQALDCKREEVYRIDYDGVKCYKPEEVIERARTKLGEKNYSLLMNNCEHFARWSKIGSKDSCQVSSFFEVLNRSKKALTTELLKVLKHVVVGDNQIRGGLKATSGWSVVNEVLGDVAICAVEIRSCYKDISAAYENQKAGKIEWDEFINISIKRSCQGVGACAGLVSGGIIGNALLPVYGGVIGRTLGYLLGHAPGILLGKVLVGIKDSVDHERIIKKWSKFSQFSCY